MTHGNEEPIVVTCRRVIDATGGQILGHDSACEHLNPLIFVFQMAFLAFTSPTANKHSHQSCGRICVKRRPLACQQTPLRTYFLSALNTSLALSSCYYFHFLIRDFLSPYGILCKLSFLFFLFYFCSVFLCFVFLGNICILRLQCFLLSITFTETLSPLTPLFHALYVIFK